MDITHVFKETIPVDEKYVFVIIPFDDSFKKLYTDTIYQVVTSKGFICEMADQPTNNSIIEDIIRSIMKSRFIIADISDYNTNVSYELGIAHTLQKQVIIIYDSIKLGNKFPFDISHIRARMYQNTAPGGIKLKQDLEQTIDYVRTKIENFKLTEEYKMKETQESSEVYSMIRTKFEQRANRVEYFTFHIIKLMFHARKMYTEVRQSIKDYQVEPSTVKLDAIKRNAKYDSEFLKLYNGFHSIPIG